MPLPPSAQGSGTRRVAGYSAVLAVGVAAVLAACGGGGTGTTQTTLGVTTQSVSGTITGFGSIYVDGVRYDDSLASIRNEVDSSESSSIDSSALKLGMRVVLSADDSDRAALIQVLPELQGPLSNKLSDSFVVLGKTVRIVPQGAITGTPTVFENVSGFAALTDGQVVEVHGLPDPANANILIATRVELKTGVGSSVIRLTGTIASAPISNGGGGSFQVGNVTVAYTASTRITPSIAQLTAGSKVSIWTDTSVSGNTLTAKAISVRSTQAANVSRFRISGIPSNYNSDNKTFAVQGLTVDASSATLEIRGGNLATLNSGTPVRVKGAVVSGTFKASEIRFIVLDDNSSDDDRKALESELTGVVTDFSSLGSFKVRGVLVDASGAVEFDDGVAANLANGRLVKVEGQPTATGIRAREVKFLTGR
jgi:hypothetical protein